MTRDELAAIALRYDTVVALAFRKALGITEARPSLGFVQPKGMAAAAAWSREEAFRGISECMSQKHGVLL